MKWATQVAEVCETWTASGLVADIIETNSIMENRSFLFLLGSGASVTSGIPTGGQLVLRWLQQLRSLLEGESTQDLAGWATAQNLGIPGFSYDRAAEFYSEVFRRRFKNDPEQGYAFLESAMEGAEPSFGYAVLARILSETRHRLVVTTNFDNLVADAMSIYGSRYPLVVGHESLAGFVRGRTRRPVVAKIHRDLFLEPKNDPEGTSALDPGWALALRNVLQDSTPIVIGYGGNDGSLMGFLESLTPDDIAGRIRWCYRQADGEPSEAIKRVVNALGGVMVPILGFDELMLMLGNAFEFGVPYEYVLGRARTRADTLVSKVTELEARLEVSVRVERGVDESEVARRAMRETVDRDSTPATWLRRAFDLDRTTDRVAQLREGRSRYPESVNLRIALANELQQVVDDPSAVDEAGAIIEELERERPDDPTVSYAKALYLTEVRADFEDVEKYWSVVLKSGLFTEPPEQMNYAEALMSAGQLDRAWNVMIDVQGKVQESKHYLRWNAMMALLSVLRGEGASPYVEYVSEAAPEGALGRGLYFQRFVRNLQQWAGSEVADFADRILSAVVSGSPDPDLFDRAESARKSVVTRS